MNKSVFLKQLTGHLSKMSKAEKDDILSDFEEYFACAARDGEDEQAVCVRLGDPKKIAKEYYVQKVIEEANKEKTFKTMSRAIATSAGLGVLNFLYVLFVVVVGYIVIASLYISVVGIGISAIAVFVATIVFAGMIGPFAFWLGIFGSIGLIALSVLGVIGLMQIGKLFRRANMGFLNMTKNGIRRGSFNEQE